VIPRELHLHNFIEGKYCEMFEVAVERK